MPNHRLVEPIAVLIATLLPLAPRPLGAQAGGGRLSEPLPLDVAASVRNHNGRSPINVSPDGQWIAHTVQADETVPRDTIGFAYSATGFSFAEGDARMEATLTHTETGETIRLGASTHASWAPVWSPAGGRVAFYSDEGGEAGLWIWDEETRQATRVPGIIARPFFGYEGPRWSSDGERVLLKVLPAGMTVAEANAKDPFRGGREPSLFPDVAPGQPSVLVRRVDPREAEAEEPPEPGTDDALDRRTVDLVVLDLRTQQITRLVEDAPISYFAWSPDNRSVAYTLSKGSEPNSQQPIYDIVVHDVAGDGSRTIVTDVRLGYGIEWSWSPDSRAIAYLSSGRRASGEIVIVSVDDGSVTATTGEDVPSFDPGDGEYAPLWSAVDGHLYAVADGELWRVDAASGRGERVAAIDGWRIRALVSPFERPTLWTTDGGRTAWVIARARDGERAGLFAIDTSTGESRARLQEAKSYSAIFSVTASGATGQIAYVSTDQQRLRDIWMFDTASGHARQATRLNEELDRYELGQARLIEWRGLDGQPLRGALLLPPGYRDGQRVPLVVFVYGGAMGSTTVNRFGLWGGTPVLNMHVLATRGYGVLYPDAPVREGRTMSDIVATVMPGVNAAIHQGYADPDRLAVMGQSYGSFSTLSLITQTTRFKAAVITAAVLHPDLFADYLGSIGYYEEGQGNMGGSIWDHPDRYFDNSPLFRFDQIETPLLIGQGETDGDLVPANAIFVALERLEKPVEYRLYQAEGHVITQNPNVIDFWERRLDFLAEHLDLARDARGAILLDGDYARSRH